MRWLAARDQVLPAAWVFTSCDGAHRPTARPLYPPHVRHVVRRYAQQIGLPPGISAHSLRKFCGTMIAKKYGPRQGQKALGHKLFATFEQHYLLDELDGGLSDDLF
jgi:integrase